MKKKYTGVHFQIICMNELNVLNTSGFDFNDKGNFIEDSYWQ